MRIQSVLLAVALPLLAGAAGLGYYLGRQHQAPVAAAPAPQSNPAVHVGGDGFDFSATGLSDEAWKVPSPQLEPPSELPAAPAVESFDGFQLKPPGK